MFEAVKSLRRKDLVNILTKTAWSLLFLVHNDWHVFPFPWQTLINSLKYYSFQCNCCYGSCRLAKLAKLAKVGWRYQGRRDQRCPSSFKSLSAFC